MINRMKIEDKSEKTITAYVRAVDLHVRFHDKSKTKTIPGEQFLKLFAEHILPKGIVKIRHIGFLSARSKKKDLAIARKSLGAQSPAAKVKMTAREFITLTTGKDPYLCTCCGKGEMVIVAMIPPIRGSPVSATFRVIPKDRKVCII